MEHVLNSHDRVIPGHFERPRQGILILAQGSHRSSVRPSLAFGFPRIFGLPCVRLLLDRCDPLGFVFPVGLFSGIVTGHFLVVVVCVGLLTAL